MKAEVTINEDGLAVYTIPLARPRTVEGTRYTELRMVEPHVKARMDVDAGLTSPKDIETALVANLCNVPVQLVHVLGLIDYHRVQAALENFPYPEDTNSA